MKIRKLIMIAALAMTACVAPLAVAQGDILDQKIGSVDYQNADVREVLKTLFKNANANYSIDQWIQGSVTLSMKDSKFELVLQNVLAQVNATYRYEGGMFLIVKRTEQGPVDPGEQNTTIPKKDNKIVRKIYIRSADPALIALLLSGRQDYNGGPEITSLARMRQGGLGGSGFGGGGFGNGGFGNGGFGGQGGFNGGQGGFSGGPGGSLGGNGFSGVGGSGIRGFGG